LGGSRSPFVICYFSSYWSLLRALVVNPVSPDLRLAFVWENFGPYHHARVLAVQRILGSSRVLPIEISSKTETYAWNSGMALCEGLSSLFEDAPVERCRPVEVFHRMHRLLSKRQVDVVFVPSYWPARSLAVLLAARLCGCRCVMMNDSHAGTAKARGIALLAKRIALKLFHAGLVAGAPQLRYFEGLGMQARSLFTGYDCVDNHYFEAATSNARVVKSATRMQLGLPDQYLLNVGRMVGKKNLQTLVEAFSMLIRRNAAAGFHLVLTGSGEREPALKVLCSELGLPVYTRTKPMAEPAAPPGVHFLGFRQIADNAAIYALASVFVLPSSVEEWGLVVNEAMASGLPVVVSERAGCAEDLLPAISSDAKPRYESEAGRESHGLKLRFNGCVFDPNSAEELSRCLEILIAKPVLRDLMASESRKVVAAFSTENFARQALVAANHACGGRGRC
jgi:glycosyltransferase involved in cell wall biosynthesis